MNSLSTRLAIFSSGKLVVWGVLVVCITATLVAWRHDMDNVDQVSNRRFQVMAEEMYADVEQRMLALKQVLLGMKGAFSITQHVNRAAWRRYYESLNLEKNYPGILGVGFGEYVPRKSLDRYLRKIHADHNPGFSIYPKSDRAVYVPVTYLEPLNERNNRAIGYDMYSEPVRHKAFDLARDTGQMAITGKITLVQEGIGKVQAGLLMMVPIYDEDKPIDTVQQRRQALVGFAYSPLRMDDLIGGVIDRGDLSVRMQIFDGDNTVPAKLMYDSLPGYSLRKDHYYFEKAMDFNGHHWIMHISSTPQFEAAVVNRSSAIILISGVVITLLVVMVMRVLSNRHITAKLLADQMTEAMRGQAQLLDSVVENLPSMLFLKRASDLSFVLFNKAGEDLLGYSSEEILGKNEHDFLDKQQADLFLQKDRAALAKRSIEDIPQESITTRSGEERVLHTRKIVLSNENGEPQYLLGISEDITEQMRLAKKTSEAVEKAKNSEARLRAVLDNIIDCIITINERGMIESFNKAAEKIFGYSAEEMIGRDVKILIPDHYQSKNEGRSGDYFMSWISEIIGKTLEVSGRRRDSSIFPMELAVSEIWLGSRRVFTGVVRDLTERKKIDRMKNEFVSMVSHELRTPLTSIRGSLGLIAGGAVGAVDTKVKSLIDIAHVNSDRLVRLINDILDIEKIEAGKMSYKMKDYEVEGLIEQAIADSRGYADQFNVLVKVVSNMPKIRLHVDTDRFQQVMNNLISNAVKFSPEGRDVEISISVFGNGVRIAVRDYGPGVPAEFRDRIFKKFAQADSSDTRQKGGTGLGLSISQAIVQRFGGRLDFEDANPGTSFFFDLPLIGRVLTFAEKGLSLDSSPISKAKGM